MFFKLFIFLIVILIVKDYMNGGIMVETLINGGTELFSDAKDFINKEI